MTAAGGSARLLAAAVLVGVVYLGALAVLPRHVFWSPDEGAKYLQVRAVQWTAGLSYALPYPPERLERELGAAPSRCTPTGFYPTQQADGSVRFHWPMWFPVLARPFFAAFGLSGLYVIPLLAGLLTAVVAGRLAETLAPGSGAAALLLVGLGSPIFFYSLCFWEHTLATLLGLIAVAAVALAQPGRSAMLLAAAPLLAIASLLRPEMLALAAACAVGWAAGRRAVRGRRDAVAASGTEPGRRWWPLALLALGVLAALLSLPGAVAPRHAEFLAELPEMLRLAIGNLPALAQNLVALFIGVATDDGPQIALGWDAAAFLAAGVCLIAPLYRSRRLRLALLVPAMLAVLGFSAAVLVSAHWYGAVHGVVPIAPYVVVAAYTSAAAWRQRDGRVAALAAAALSYMAIAFLFIFLRDKGVPQTGLEWGARYVLTLYPMAAVLAVLAWRFAGNERGRVARPALRGILVAMMLVAVGYQIRGVTMLYHRRSEIAAWHDVLRDAAPVVTDIWWLPAAVAPLFVAQEVYCLANRDELTAWLAAAAVRGPATVTVATLAPLALDGLPGGRGRAAVLASERVAGMYFVRVRIVADAAPPDAQRGEPAV